MALDQVEIYNKEDGKEKEMSFLDHLEELRWHLIRAVSSIIILAIIVFLSKDFVWHNVILAPSRLDFWTYQMMCQAGEYFNSPALCIQDLPFIIQNRKMTGQFTMHITSSALIGLLVAFPYVFWEIWRFIKPGLRKEERKHSQGAVFFVSFLFTLGVLFGYYIISPLSINFLAHYSVDGSISNEFELSNYVSTISMIVLASAVLFQLPMVVYFLSKAGLITPHIMKHYRKHAIVVILIMGALLTPPDPMSQILIAFPLFGLYQISIFISAWVVRNKKRKQLDFE